ncbi:unnamed protein product [Rhizoctonia solani]|uniref:Peptidase C14 caspase domain-containing protein n=1 Tax=Rhizoctonia solani TaxID=456999 RepID=A0A8H3BHY8_9AGAM|nr:unnamed protein product [Rhizoctonia solani]
MLLIGLVALERFKGWSCKGRLRDMLRFVQDRVPFSSPNERLPSRISATLVLGGRDLSQQLEGVPAYASNNQPSQIPQKDLLGCLKAPRCKGRSESLVKANVPKGLHKALVIGLNSADSHGEPLNHAIRDAKNFEGCLKKLNNLSGGFHFEVEMLIDEDRKSVPRTRVFRALEKLFSGAKPDDLLVLFFSGHCSKNQSNGVVSLMTVEDNQSFRLIPSTVFSTYISKLPPGCTVEIFLDSCYSGGLIQLDNTIRDMAPGNVAPEGIHSSPFSTGAPFALPTRTGPFPAVSSSAVQHLAYGVSAAPIQKYTESDSGKGPGVIAGMSSSPRNPTHAASPGPQPGVKISTEASVVGLIEKISSPGTKSANMAQIVWAASGSGEKAYESCRIEGGPLANAICDEIIKSAGGTVQREVLWNRVM